MRQHRCAHQQCDVNYFEIRREHSRRAPVAHSRTGVPRSHETAPPPADHRRALASCCRVLLSRGFLRRRRRGSGVCVCSCVFVRVCLSLHLGPATHTLSLSHTLTHTPDEAGPGQRGAAPPGTSRASPPRGARAPRPRPGPAPPRAAGCVRRLRPPPRAARGRKRGLLRMGSLDPGRHTTPRALRGQGQCRAAGCYQARYPCMVVLRGEKGETHPPRTLQ
jgi:hypothetical protein